MTVKKKNAHESCFNSQNKNDDKARLSLRHLPWVDAQDSHFAKFAIPRTTWERTSGYVHISPFLAMP